MHWFKVTNSWEAANLSIKLKIFGQNKDTVIVSKRKGWKIPVMK